MSCLGLQGVELQLCRAADAAEQAAAAVRSLREQRDAVSVLSGIADALASLLLPLLLVVAFWRLWPVLRQILETRKFTIRIAGFELSAQEATDQLRRQIEDLQAKVAALRPVPALLPEGAQAGAAPPPQAPEPTAQDAAAAAPPRILWVDDHPEGNAALVAGFEGDGVQIETVRTGGEAVAWLWSDPQRFAAVVTDQGRVEDGRYRSDAGTALIRELRGGGNHVPVAVFTSARGVRMGRDALEAGAEIVTASAVDLRAFVARHTGRGRADQLHS